MNDIGRLHNSFINKNRFVLHGKRNSISIPVRKEVEGAVGVKSNILPFLKLNSSNRGGCSSNIYTQRHASSSSFAFTEVLYPITPAYAVKSCIHLLSQYEESEVSDYSLIYFISNKNCKSQVNYLEKNFAFDDNSGNYKIILGDHIAYRYEITDLLGKGSFGQVCRAFDHKLKQFCAIKIIKNKQKFHKQAAIEINILKYLTNNDAKDLKNCIKLQENFLFRKHLCLKFEVLQMNLYEFIKSTGYKGVPLGLIKAFALQIAVALQFFSSFGVIHCDLKPENILLVRPQGCEVKVIDFGSACFANSRIFSYIQSRFYRAPEVILGLPYNFSIDVWSFGCILAELYIGYPLFPGENENEQLLYIMEYLGTPPAHVLSNAYRFDDFFDSRGKVINDVNSKGKVRRPGTKKLSEKISTSDKKFLNLIERKYYLGCLDWDPAFRITPDEIIVHPWFTGQNITKKY